MRKLIFALSIVLAWVSVEGLYCFTCINAPDNESCQRNGEYKRCLENENACHNSVRRSAQGVMITKQCKQVSACENNYLQNPRAAWWPTQCNEMTSSSVCRCCCKTDGCNGPEIICNKGPICDRLPTPDSSTQTCNKKQMFVGTVCKFRCERGHRMIGSRRTVCREVQGLDAKFENAPPRCQRRRCLQITNVPQHGIMTCTNGSRIGSVCSFECGSLHKLLGDKELICLSIGEWSSIPPACVLASCPAREPPVNGGVSCTHENYEDSECTFSCNDDYKVIGDESSICLDINSVGIWSTEVPICEVKTCQPIESPDNGYVVCDDGVKVGSRCTFYCNENFRRVGNRINLCAADRTGEAVWRRNTPTCEPIRCDDSEPFFNGEVTCTNGNNAGSVCTYTCDEDKYYTLQPPDRKTNVCLNDSTWNVARPCCYANCPPQTIFDGLIILDSSSSIGSRNFRTVKRFVQLLVGLFDISLNASRVGVFRYNRQVDTRTQIHLDDYVGDREGLLAAIDRIPYDGSGTNTGKALRHARREFREEDNGNRLHVRDIVIVITDGVSYDSVSKISQKLKDDGVVVIAVGVVPPIGRLDFEQLNDIVTTPDDLLIAGSGFAGLNTDLFHRIGNRFCVKGCLKQ